MTLKLLFNDLITISLITAIIISVIALLYATLCKRYKSKWICLIWIVLSIRLIIPFNPELAVVGNPVQIPEPERTPISLPKSFIDSRQQKNLTPPESKPYDIREIYGINSSASSPNTETTSHNSDVHNTNNSNTNNDEPIEPDTTETVWVDSTILLCLAWLLGAFIALIIRSIQLIRFKMFLKSNITLCDNQYLLTVLNHVKLELNLHKKITVFYCNKISSPMVTGIFKVKLLMPNMEYSKIEMYAVTRHEMSHIKLHHLEIKMLALTCEIIHWFNPFVYLMSKLLNRDLEFACDAKVLKSTSNTYREEYSKAILSVAGKVQKNNDLQLKIS